MDSLYAIKITPKTGASLLYLVAVDDDGKLRPAPIQAGRVAHPRVENFRVVGAAMSVFTRSAGLAGSFSNALRSRSPLEHEGHQRNGSREQ